MPLAADLFAVLNGATAAADRVYPVEADQNAIAPFIVYQRISSDPVSSLNGNSGLDSVRVQIDCYAQTNEQAWTMARAVRTALNGQSFKPLLLTESDAPPDPSTRLYRVTQDYRLWDRP